MESELGGDGGGLFSGAASGAASSVESLAGTRPVALPPRESQLQTQACWQATQADTGTLRVWQATQADTRGTKRKSDAELSSGSRTLTESQCTQESKRVKTGGRQCRDACEWCRREWDPRIHCASMQARPSPG